METQKTENSQYEKNENKIDENSENSNQNYIFQN